MFVHVRGPPRGRQEISPGGLRVIVGEAWTSMTAADRTSLRLARSLGERQEGVAAWLPSSRPRTSTTVWGRTT